MLFSSIINFGGKMFYEKIVKFELEKLLATLLSPKSWNDTTLTSVKQKLKQIMQKD